MPEARPHRCPSPHPFRGRACAPALSQTHEGECGGTAAFRVARRESLQLSTLSRVAQTIWSHVAVVLMPEEFSKAGAGAVDPALDRANLRATHLRRLLVSETFGSDQ